MDKSSEAVLKTLYDILSINSEASVSSPEYNKEQIDSLVNSGYLEKLISARLVAGIIL